MNTQKMQMAALVLAVGLSGAAQAATTYSVTTLGASGGSSYGINASGQVVGSSYDGVNVTAFLYSGGSMTNLGTLGGLSSSASGINASGQIVGGAETADGTYHAFIYSNGSMTDLGTSFGGSSYATGINDSGQVVGNFITADGFTHAFLYNNGSMTDLGTFSGGFESLAFGINASGQVAGGADTADGVYHAFRYSNGSMTELGQNTGLADSDVNAYAFDINDNGYVVGYFHENDVDYAFWEIDGDVASIIPGYAADINASLQIVGTNLSTGIVRGFLYSYATGSTTNLSSLIDPASGSDWVIENAYRINDSGQIVATGFQNIGGGYSGALLLTPTAVPEPETYAMLLAGLGLVGFASRRRATMQ